MLHQVIVTVRCGAVHESVYAQSLRARVTSQGCSKSVAVLMLCLASIQVKVFFDGSNVAKRPTELMYIFAPTLNLGAVCPPMAGALQIGGCRWLCVCWLLQKTRLLCFFCWPLACMCRDSTSSLASRCLE